MRVQTTDPMTGNDVQDLEHAPFVMEGRGEDALKIYFESESSRQSYLEVETRSLSDEVARFYNGTTGTAQEM